MNTQLLNIVKNYTIVKVQNRVVSMPEVEAFIAKAKEKNLNDFQIALQLKVLDGTKTISVASLL